MTAHHAYALMPEQLISTAADGTDLVCKPCLFANGWTWASAI